MGKRMDEMTQKESLARELPKGLLQWYGFPRGAHILFVAGGEPCFEVLPEAMEEKGAKVDRTDIGELDKAAWEDGIQGAFSHACSSEGGVLHDFNGKGQKSEAVIKKECYDYIVLAGTLERSRHPMGFLKILRCLLKPDGTLLVGTYNRLGIGYFCGDRDPFTERNFDGIEDYGRVGKGEWEKISGRCYAKAELTGMLETAGFKHHKFYSVLPEWTRPQILWAENHLPDKGLMEQTVPQYHSPDTIFLEEERLYDTLTGNGLFHIMSNGYLIECPLNGRFADASQVMVSAERGKKEALVSILHGDGTTSTKPLYEDGRGKAEQMLKYAMDLRKHGIKTVGQRIKQDSLITDPGEGESGLEYFRRLVCEDKAVFLREMDHFMEFIENSSEHVPYEEIDWEHFDPDWRRRKDDDPGRDGWKRIAFGSGGKSKDLGVILKNGYMDLIPGKCFYINGEFIFFGQEWCIEQMPAHVIRLRAIDQIYQGKVWENGLVAREELMDRYHLHAYERLWWAYMNRFTDRLWGNKELLGYHQHHRRDWKLVNANRYRMNYSENEYERVFKHIFDGVQGRQLYVFGSGIYGEKFLEQFGDDYQVAKILDNNRERWGKQLSGIKIFPPEIVRFLPEDSYKIIVCIKNFVPVLEQLKKLGVLNYSVYDWHQEYQRKLPQEADFSLQKGTQPKKYHVGYIAGVFDLFHVGHLNMFKRAKEQCDYLIVGVVNDESVMANKKTMPYVPFEERIELVRSCRYVDEAVELPADNGDTDEAYGKYQFDVQFSGSDYANDPEWLAKKSYLEKRGARLVFFPYTASTSSTKLKGLIEKGLL